MTVIKHQLFIAAALLVGVAIGYFAAPTAPVAVEPATPVSTHPSKELPVRPDAAELARLRGRVAELEARLKNGDARQDLRAGQPVSNAVVSAEMPRPPDPREMMENLRKTDPARYTQMTNRFAQFRRNRAARAQKSADFLASIDTSNWGASARQTHAKLQALTAQREELEESIHRQDLTNAERDQLFEQMRQTDHALRKANRAERTALMTEVAQALGLEGEAAEELIGTVKDIYEATGEGNRMGPPPMMGGPPPGTPPSNPR